MEAMLWRCYVFAKSQVYPDAGLPIRDKGSNTGFRFRKDIMAQSKLARFKKIASIVTILVALPVLLLFYQNCGGQFESLQNITDSSRGSSGQPCVTEVELTWSPPAARENGEELTTGELGGYILSYGQEQKEYTETIGVPDPRQTDLTISDLADGTYYFAIRAYDKDELYSQYSNEVSAQIEHCTSTTINLSSGVVTVATNKTN